MIRPALHRLGTTPARYYLGAGAVAFCLGTLVSRRDIWSYDGYVMWQVARSMVTEHSFRVWDDDLGMSTPYAPYGLGMSLWMAIAEYVTPALGINPVQVHTLINPLAVGATAVAVWFLVRALGAGPRLAAAVAVAIATATPLLPYAATNFAEPCTALGVALGLLAITYARDRPVLAGALLGVAVGLTTLMRFDSLPLIAPVVGIALLVTARARLTAAAACVAAATPGLALAAAYNMLRFGSPVQTGYPGLPEGRAWSHPLLTGVYGLVASPGRGLLIYAPVALVMVLFWRPVWRRSPVLALACAALLVDRILVYAVWHGWHGGVTWGPRFLVPAMPALAPFLMEAFRWVIASARSVREAGTGIAGVRAALRASDARGRLRTAGAAGVCALVAVSVAVQLIGALTDPAQDRLLLAIRAGEQAWPDGMPYVEWATSAQDQAIWDSAMMDWSLLPVADHANRLVHGRNLVTRFIIGGGNFPLLAVVLLVLVFGVRGAFRLPPSGPAPPSARAGSVRRRWRRDAGGRAPAG